MYIVVLFCFFMQQMRNYCATNLQRQCNKRATKSQQNCNDDATKTLKNDDMMILSKDSGTDKTCTKAAKHLRR